MAVAAIQLDALPVRDALNAWNRALGAFNWANALLSESLLEGAMVRLMAGSGADGWQFFLQGEPAALHAMAEMDMIRPAEDPGMMEVLPDGMLGRVLSEVFRGVDDPAEVLKSSFDRALRDRAGVRGEAPEVETGAAFVGLFREESGASEDHTPLLMGVIELDNPKRAASLLPKGMMATVAGEVKPGEMPAMLGVVHALDLLGRWALPHESHGVRGHRDDGLKDWRERAREVCFQSALDCRESEFGRSAVADPAVLMNLTGLMMLLPMGLGARIGGARACPEDDTQE